jgi:hypothetical protein
VDFFTVKKLFRPFGKFFGERPLFGLIFALIYFVPHVADSSMNKTLLFFVAFIASFTTLFSQIGRQWGVANESEGFSINLILHQRFYPFITSAYKDYHVKILFP